ncbi:hypothetical protein A3I42_00225 [Candidatus Uhrbacteria bacterium RIFCSPLOWO2_02_FULL_49_11]|uniref:Beta-glucosidase n=1 Tax=Candidatus Uhrbacteria bacterium RIFCSPLOWO2_02_FULL_49_11 TaxID=1802409 RepID=A0A1F7VD33_9BACT|nr:MAG: hypothetical protein A3I42_00225 [Candidatus Uhrbacteria bacterium RIFCSPLOWO2_02_FULL_49_11]
MDQINEEIISFPHGFLWGTATAAHQVEGDNIHSDWWSWERSARRAQALKQEGKNAEDFISGHACDHYHRFEEDFDLVKRGGQNAHRLSLEWSRVEPEEGVWDEKEIEHYREVLEMLKQRGIKTFVTLWHFTNPQWLSARGGWLKGSTVNYFVRYCEKMARTLGDLVDVWVTLNEPGAYVHLSYHWGWWPPQKRSRAQMCLVLMYLACAHRRAWKTLKSVTRGTPVGIAQNVISYAAYRKHHLWDHLLVWMMDVSTNHLFYWLSGMKRHDYLGFNYYFRVRLKRRRGSIFAEQDSVKDQGREVSAMGWELYPHGIFDSLMDFADIKKPVYILENGIATDDDTQRQKFIIEHLREVYHAIKGGVDVRGYFHWSLLDNFEWHEGWRPKFGLVAVDRETFKRTPKESFYLFKKIAEENSITNDEVQSSNAK